MNLINKILYKLNPLLIIRKSDYFDSNWYSKQYNVSKRKAAYDYCRFGWKNNNNPSLKFSTKDYLINNPDIVNTNPLLHYEVFGKYEGRIPFPARNSFSIGNDEYSNYSINECYKLIEKAEIISFDVFDTLIKRPFAKADDLFSYIENKYEINGFKESRISAEKNAREILNKEVNIDEIYAFIGDKYKQLKEIESEEEISLCEANPEINKIYCRAKELGKHIIVVSDMYFGKKMLNSLLLKCGYNIDEIHVSCEYNKTKANGDLFDEVIGHYQVDSNKILHIGDNYISDFINANNKGLVAYNTPVFTDILLSNKDNNYLNAFINSGKNELQSSIHFGLCCDYLYNKGKTLFEKLGFVLGGPLALSYLNFVCRSSIKDNIDKLFFVARDGYVLKEIYKKYFFDEYKLPYSYAYLSRATVLSATFADGDDISSLLKVVRSKLKHITVYENENDNIDEFNKKQSEISDYINNRKDELRKHLIKEANDCNRIAIVDMASKNLTSLKGAKSFLNDNVYIGYFAGVFNNSESIRYSSFLDRFLGVMDNLPIKISELLITSYENPIIGVQDNNPIYDGEAVKERVERFNEILNGIIEYCDVYSSKFEFNSNVLLSFEQWLKLCSCYLLYCPNNELKDLGNIVDSENPTSSINDRTFKELILEYRKNVL